MKIMVYLRRLKYLFVKRQINDYSAKERPEPTIRLQPIDQKYVNWINKHVSATNLNQTFQYCELMRIEFPELSIVEGAVHFDRKDIKNKWGKFTYLVDNVGNPVNPMMNLFDQIYEYKTNKIIVKSEIEDVIFSL